MHQKLPKEVFRGDTFRLLRGHADVRKPLSVRCDLVSSDLGNPDAVLADCRKQKLIHVFLHVVIAVHKAKVFALCPVYPRISCGGGTAVFLVEHADPCILPGQPVSQFTGPVRGAVIHQQDLQIAVGLPAQGFHASWQVLRHIIDRHDNAEQRFFFFHVHVFSHPPALSSPKANSNILCRPARTVTVFPCDSCARSGAFSSRRSPGRVSRAPVRGEPCMPRPPPESPSLRGIPQASPPHSPRSTHR